MRIVPLFDKLKVENFVSDYDYPMRLGVLKRTIGSLVERIDPVTKKMAGHLTL
jgi:hypothetical protein